MWRRFPATLLKKTMKTTFFTILLATLLLLGKSAQAQVSAYSFSQTLGVYGPVNIGTHIGTHFQDDDVNTASLPFGFVFNGNTYTTVNVCSNGYLSFNALTGTEYTAVSDNMTSQLIAPFAQDLFMGTVIFGDVSSGSNTITNVSNVSGINVGDSIMDIFFNFGGINPTVTAISGNNIVVNINSSNTASSLDLLVMNGSIRQLILGSAPNRICEFEYRNMTRFGVYDESFNFKIQLYETSNKIEFIYGNFVPGLSSTASEVGLKGTSNADFKSRHVNANNAWLTSFASTVITNDCVVDVTKYPNYGLIYSWMPVSCTNPVLNIVQSSASVCAGQSATLTANGAGTYSWSSGSSASVIVVNPLSTITYTLFGYNGTCSSSLSVTQQVIPGPLLNVVATKSAICSGQSNTLTVSGAGTYSWSNGSLSSVLVINPVTTSSYTVFGFNGICSASLNVVQQVIPNPTLQVVSTKSIICKGQTNTLTVSGASSYTWNTGSNAAILIINPLVSTVYSVSGSNNGCVSQFTFNQLVSNCTGINEGSSREMNLSVYPNPFRNVFNVLNPYNKTASIKLVDLLGNCVLIDEIEAQSNKEFSSESVNHGVYLLILEEGENKLVKKIIKD